VYKVELKRQPEKFIRQQDRRIQVQLVGALRKLAENPRPPQAKKLEGMEGLYRFRSGDYRIVYLIEDDKLIVLVVRIGHRKEIYREL
jgi:mRNA interferase RelE/StbE